MTYESIKQLTATFQGSSSPTSPGPVAVAGGLCGLVSWATVGSCLPCPPPSTSGANANLCRPIQSTRPNRDSSATACPWARADAWRSPRSNGSVRRCIAVYFYLHPPGNGARARANSTMAGLGVSMARSCITNAIFFSAFEFVKKRINALEDPKPLVGSID